MKVTLHMKDGRTIIARNINTIGSKSRFFNDGSVSTTGTLLIDANDVAAISTEEDDTNNTDANLDSSSYECPCLYCKKNDDASVSTCAGCLRFVGWLDMVKRQNRRTPQVRKKETPEDGTQR